ncbi:MAG: hypothetical protein ACR2NP_01080, partial [Pirellulaceae bacterium]
MNPATDLRLDLVTAPLHCCFVDCEYVWQSELRRIIPPNRHLVFRELASNSDLASQLPSRAFVLLGLAAADLPSLRKIHDLYWRGHRVVAIGNGNL